MIIAESSKDVNPGNHLRNLAYESPGHLSGGQFHEIHRWFLISTYFNCMTTGGMF